MPRPYTLKNWHSVCWELHDNWLPNASSAVHSSLALFFTFLLACRGAFPNPGSYARCLEQISPNSLNEYTLRKGWCAPWVGLASVYSCTRMMTRLISGYWAMFRRTKKRQWIRTSVYKVVASGIFPCGINVDIRCHECNFGLEQRACCTVWILISLCARFQQVSSQQENNDPRDDHDQARWIRFNGANASTTRCQENCALYCHSYRAAYMSLGNHSATLHIRNSRRSPLLFYRLQGK